MQILVPHLDIKSNQVFGAIFPTQELFQISIIYLWVSVLDIKLTSFIKNILLSSSLIWDNRKIYLSVLLEGDENRYFESSGVGTS